MARKLGARQRRIIDRLKSGDTLHWCTGLHAFAFWSGSEKSQPYEPVLRLEKLGLIARKDQRNYGWTYVLTPEGHKA